VDYPVIGTELASQLAGVEPSTDGRREYRPCRVVLTDGRILDRVYVVEAGLRIDPWGVWPDEDPTQRQVALAEVVRIEDSPVRLPATYANELYAAGESGMGYTVFMVVLTDGRRLSYVGRTALDFPAFPDGVRSSDVAAVLPHKGREHVDFQSQRAEQQVAEYYWCLYTSPAEAGRR
jgi:Mg-chelatase subunit ChlD